MFPVLGLRQRNKGGAALLVTRIPHARPNQGGTGFPQNRNGVVGRAFQN